MTLHLSGAHRLADPEPGLFSTDFEILPDGRRVARVRKRGRDVLRDPLINKGSAFSPEERAALGLQGLLPSAVTDIDKQMRRVLGALEALPSDLTRYVELADLQDRNEVLFYRLLIERTEQLMPIVYTPTVGEASQNFSHIFRRARGRWITPAMKGRIADVLRLAGGADIRLVVVTDNERILGLGDQGAGGMAIPVGKLALYTAGAGLHPSHTLPISLDVGTDNEELLEDPLYLGYRAPRLRGAEYDELVEEFAAAVKSCFPRAVLQWEDFKKANAFGLLDRYRERLTCFNDDIQGTAGVTVAGLLAACAQVDRPLTQHRVLILGAGAAGIGIAQLLRSELERLGLDDADLRRAIALIDSRGLLVADRRIDEAHKEPFAWPTELAERYGLQGGADLETVIGAWHPTVLIGTTGQPGIFSEEIVREMAEYTDRPVIFPLSNPTSKAEAVPADLLAWTEGRAIVATGSPFDPVSLEERTFRIAQANNVYVFPGVGLGAIAVSAREISDAMFATAARTLAAQVSAEQARSGTLYPPLTELRAVSRAIAIDVAREAVANGLADPPPGEDYERAVDRWVWYPHYPEIQAV